MSRPDPLDDDWLRDHGAALRAFGRALLGGDVAGEDAAQDALAAALERPAGVRDLGAWLRTVTRRGALRRARERERRRERERAVARPERVAAAADVAARAEIVRRVGEVVAELREPYREALLLRFFEGLAPRAIAARLEVPVATVDSRIQRGLALARAALERSSAGEARSWTHTLAVALGLDPLGAPAPSTTINPVTPLASGLLGGLTTMKLSLVLAGAVGALALALVAGRLRTTAEPLAAPGADSLGVAAPAAPTAVRADPPAEPGREPARESAALAIDEPPAPAPSVAPRAVHGLVLDPRGVALAGADVFLGEDSETLRHVTTSDADGSFVVEVLERELRIGARAAGFAPSALHDVPERASDELRLVLPTIGLALDVLVSDAVGAPVEGARVRIGRERDRTVRQADGASGRTLPGVSSVTDAAGRARFEGLAPGWQRVAAVADGLAPRSTFVTLTPEGPERVELALAPGLTVEGIVRASSGRPVADALVARGEARERVARSDSEGRYRLGPVDAGKVVVTGPAGRRVERRVSGRAGDFVRWDPVLTDDASLRGRALDADGRPLAGAWVSAHHDTWPGWTRASVTDELGRFVIHGCPEQPLRVELRGDATDALPRLVVDSLLAGPSEHDLRVHALAASVVGSVDASALPAASPAGGTSWLGTSELRLQHVGSPQRQRLTGGPGARLELDERGAFALDALAPGDYELVALGAPYGWLRLARFTLTPGDAYDLGRLVLPPPGLLRTESLRPAGMPSSSAAFTLERRADFVTLLRHDGSFPPELSLAPGSYVLEVELTPGPRAEYPFTITSERESVLRVDLRATCRHRVRLRHAAGQAAAGEVQLEVSRLDLEEELDLARATVRRSEDGDWIHDVELGPGRYRFTARFPTGDVLVREVPLFTSEPGREVLLVHDER